MIARPRTCRICGARLPKDKRRTLCRSAQCHAAAAGEPFGTNRRGQPSGGRVGPAYRAVVAVVRRRAMDGEPCYFCRGGFVWTLPSNDGGAFTAHHLDALMDGHPAVTDPSRMVPAHRSCNSSDGLRQANARRATLRKARQTNAQVDYRG